MVVLEVLQFLGQEADFLAQPLVVFMLVKVAYQLLLILEPLQEVPVRLVFGMMGRFLRLTTVKPT